MQVLTHNIRCNKIHAAHIQNTWKQAEAEFIISNRNNIKLFYFTMSGDRKIVFVLLIFHAFGRNPPQFGQMNAVTRQYFHDSTLSADGNFELFPISAYLSSSFFF